MTTIERPAPIDPSITAPPYRRFTWQEAIIDYLPAHRRTPRARVWVERLPTLAILLLTALLAARLRNSAFIDEALYINAGQDYLNHLLHGSSVPNHGDYFSGAPAVYPVLAATLDAVGGLYLVRFFSLLCVLATVVVVQDLAQTLFRSRRAGLLAGAAFALTGSVIFLGAFATFDALCVLLLSVAMWLGVKKQGSVSAVGIGLALSLAVTVKYAGAVFVPVVLAVVVLVGPHAVKRAALALGTLCVVVAGVLFSVGDSLRPGIAFTTSTRTALSPTAPSQLLVYVALNIGLLVALALLGAWRAERTRRSVLLVLVLLVGAALLPAAQLRLGEAVSFDKHTAYAALFLAPLAGLGLASLSRGLFKLAPVLVLMLVSLIAGVSRSGTLYAGWVPLDPVLSVINSSAAPGLYISSSTDALKYYTRKNQPDVRWETTFALYSTGEDRIRSAVAGNRFQMIILRSASTGSAQQDSGQRVLEQAIADNPRYQLVREPFPVQPYSTDRWFVYRLGSGPGEQLYRSDSSPAVPPSGSS